MNFGNYALYKPQPVYRGLYEFEPLLDTVRDHGLFIAGGLARWMLSPHAAPAPCNDADVYGFTHELQTGEFRDSLKGKMHWFFAGQYVDGYTRFENLTGSMDHRWLIMPDVQAVLLNYLYDHTGTIEEKVVAVLDKFDLDCCRAAVFWDENAYVWRGFAYTSFQHAERNKIVDVEGSSNPVATLKRLRKYRDKGYTVANGAAETCLKHWRLLPQEQRNHLLCAENIKGIAQTEYTYVDEFGNYDSWLSIIETTWMTKREIYGAHGE